ncbi:MAG: LCP family protein [Brevibacterium aurantiacum]|uniref:LytR family transcriptional regulator n=1 Tax=Brevibacterium aurantiacum TaxID=273384 RepID=A0A2A3YYK9_BREAU|nr:LCP family protein [Brevibacterium aurantiacum]MDN5586271.1 LCP family protein [Brevibacterium sp.]PCC44420.1 LytR family transcriptional regulator [Brevibacterium aurantiacum]PCC57869.1 LytR family transcriptional regulator [Brevibacterium aurantiacum]SMX84370.1 transcriptional attenuator, LytR family [Brevibacterium aurantiacum]
MAETRYVDPIHHPSYASQPTRDVRAWILLLVTVLIPGGVQLLFRARRWAKISLSITALSWILAIIALIVVLIDKKFLFTIGTNTFLLTFLTIWLPVIAINWIVCLFDALRRIKLVTLSARARKRFLAAFCALVLVVVGPLAWGTTLLDSQRGLMADLFASGKAAKPVDGRYNILLLGSDAGKGRTGIRPDSLSLVSIDAKTGKTVIVGLPRNMENVPFPKDSPLHKQYPQGFNCGDECLLNAVFQQGERHKDEFENPKRAGEQATMDAASAVTGLEVQYFAMVNLKGFENLIDSLGGITLVSGKRVPISSKVDPTTGEHGPVKGWIEPGKQKLDGFHALWFARSREFSSDYERMIRQRCVQTAMVKQLDPATVLTRYQEIAKATPGALSTDIPSSEVDEFVDLALKVKSQKIESLDLTPPNVTPSHPDFDAARTLVADAIAESSKDAEKDKDAQAAPGDTSGALAGVNASRGLATGVSTQISAQSGTGSGSDEGKESAERAICYVP